jgi:hypothetical protein
MTTSSSSFSSSRCAPSVVVGHRLDGLAAVVELEDQHAAAAAVDQPRVGDDAGQHLRLAAVHQFGDGRRQKRRTSSAQASNRWPDR